MPVTWSVALVSVVTTATLAVTPADAHGYLSSPTITAAVNSAFGGHEWNRGPEFSTATFTSAFPNTGYSSLRDMLDQQVADCANTRIDVSPVDVAGLTVVTWENGNGITSHRGPCEVWVDDIVVNHQDDCVATYGAGTQIKVPANFSKCLGDCTLRFYWLALHEPKWQIYKQCVPIVNNSGARALRTA
ncbi:hypothetical protein PHYSODRAFT_255975 [Phytophthora sojae]|uniref:Chitin-binding type-4 domain-containing protein n=1 Tax=Phytophthora sojae (strain P6497) TaxID=1094619 RepID=G5A8A2_PHYSP|nr:hypothetical protein PHYSODRAFT_255975 [Phytophthora sojae]EGZ08128.1 hypothetical protein PHYSODRAFT_255975 [Phytophthora sojae]|eukprot:XP_009536300.1 hypothetical protein PHYSODRAFT_255975 [Phytophthora sojae]